MCNKLKKRQIINNISDRLEIPRDVIGNEARITMIGRGVVFIEGFLGIFQYDEKKTIVRVPKGMVAISGEGIFISGITEEFIELKGDIKTIEFM